VKNLSRNPSSLPGGRIRAARPGAARAGALLLLGMAALVTADRAHAELGGAFTSFAGGPQQAHAAVRATGQAGFSVSELRTSDGAILREYAAPGGQVFGVSWSGPNLPNLRQLLGVHFDTYTSSPNRQRGGLGHLVVHEGALVVESGGRMRSFHGRAYLSNALPAGVTTDDIQ